MSKTVIKILSLTNENFAPFGEVIGCTGHEFFHINEYHQTLKFIYIRYKFAANYSIL